MRFSKFRGLCSVVTSLCAGACGFGGQTGEGDERGPACVETAPEEVPLVDSSRLGFDAEGVLVFASRTHSFATRWPSGEGQEGSGTLTATPHGAVRFIDSHLDRELETENPCYGRLETDATIDLALANAAGTVHASFDTVLTFDAKDIARFRADVSPASFTGDTQFVIQPGERVKKFLVSAVLSPLGTAGRVEAVVSHVETPPSSSEPQGDAPRAGPYELELVEPLARWPSESTCGAGELPVPLSQTLLDVSPGDVLRMLASEGPLTWKDGTTTLARVEAASRTGSACLRGDASSWFERIDWHVVDPQDRTVLGAPVTLSVDTDDARWSGQIDTLLHVEVSKRGGLERAWISQTVAFPSAGTLLERIGLSSVSLDANQPASVHLRIVYAAGGSSLAPSGTMTVDTPDVDPCSEGEMCTGGPGRRVLESARFGSEE